MKMKVNEEKLQVIIKDLKLLYEERKKLSNLNIKMKLTNNVEEYIEYAIKTNVISTAHDIAYISQKLSDMPELLNLILDAYNISNKKSKESNNSSSSSDLYWAAGTYDKLSDVPGYGTEFNHRCVPEGVYIRGSGRCSC